MQCLGLTCTSNIHRDEIFARLDEPSRVRFTQMLVDANGDPHKKTCPRCSCITVMDPATLSTVDKFGLCVTCAECQLDWCFSCQAPWHANIKCKEFRRGDKLLRAWAREHHFGQVNAQRCPKCKVSNLSMHLTCTMLIT